MAKFPEPPPADELARVPPVRKRLPAGWWAWRLYRRGGRHPTLWDRLRDFGPSAARFDHHLPPPRLQTRAILYAAVNGPTALAEAFQDTRVIDRSARDPWLAAFRLHRPVTLLDLTGTWPTRAGASMAIATGPRPRARRWAQAIYDAYPDLDGLYYPSSMHGNRPAVAITERARRAIPPRPEFHRPLADPALLRMLDRVARDLGYGLV